MLIAVNSAMNVQTVTFELHREHQMLLIREERLLSLYAACTLALTFDIKVMCPCFCHLRIACLSFMNGESDDERSAIFDKCMCILF